LVFTGAIWPKWRVWTIDLDRGVESTNLENLVTLTGIHSSIIEQSTLRPISRVISSDFNVQKPIWPWILALGSRNLKRTGGIQFCPKCLSEDIIPYYRLYWRFAWHTACLIHKCNLHDRCPRCNAPIEPHRLIATNRHMAICASCNYDLRNSTLSNINDCAFDFQNTTETVVANLEGYYGQIRISSYEWFSISRYFINLLRNAASGKLSILKVFFSRIGIKEINLNISATGLALEMLPIEERILFLAAIQKVFLAGPTRFIEIAKEISISVQSLREPYQKIPSFLHSLLCSLPERKIIKKTRSANASYHPRSKKTVMHMWARFNRKIRRIER
jgi:hypothetical protein